MLREVPVHDLHAVGPCLDGLEVLPLEIGRQRARFFRPGLSPRRIAASESLPGEIVVLHGEIAGELFQALPQYRRHVALCTVGDECLVLSWRNTEPVKRHFLRGRPAHKPLVEQRCQGSIKEASLLGKRPGAQHILRIDTVEPRHKMAEADAIAQQAMMIEVPGEQRDPLSSPSSQVPAFPVSPALRIKLIPQEAFVGLDIGLFVCLTEEPVEDVVGWKALRREQLEAPQRHVSPVQVHCRDFSRIGGEIGHDVAAARRYGHHAGTRTQVEGLHVHFGIFPDLRVDQPLESEGKQAFQHPVQG